MIEAENIKIIFYIIAGGVILLLLVRRFKLAVFQCSICRAKTSDSYRDEKDKIILLCRNHLIERWKKDVESSSQNMIIIEPDFLNYPQAYPYATPDRLKEWDYPGKAQNNIISILSTISGKECRECIGPASVAYFNKEDFEWPFFEKISATPSYLCKKCGVKKVIPLIISAQKPLEEGVYAPTDGEGVYHVQEF